MKVSGFTIVRNAVEYGYPAVEAILSILPLCDEVIVNCGIGTDSTLDLIRSIDSPKIKIIERQWDMTLRERGILLSVETNFALAECKGDWCVYIQADEVMHEKDYSSIRTAMETYLHDEHVEGLRFGYKHFYGSFDFIQDNFRQWYVQETRIIKRRPSIVSWGDAMSFNHPDGTGIHSVRIPADVYHYGWVRAPKTMKLKRENFEKLYRSDEQIEALEISENVYTHLGHLMKFSGTHPAVMKERVEMYNWDFNPHIENQLPRWLRHVILFLEPLTKRLRRFYVFGK